VTKVYKITRVIRIFISKLNLSAKVLTVSTLNIALQNSLITKIVNLLKKQKPDYCHDWDGLSPYFFIKQHKFVFKIISFNLFRQ
jgi:hypothetical protein